MKKSPLKILAMILALSFSQIVLAGYQITTVTQQTVGNVDVGDDVYMIVTVVADEFGASTIDLFVGESANASVAVSESLCSDCGALEAGVTRSIIVGPLFSNIEFEDQSSQIVVYETYWSGNQQENVVVSTTFISQLNDLDINTDEEIVDSIQLVCEGATSATLRSRCDQLYSLTDEEAEEALDQLLPTEAAGERQATLALGQTQVQGVRNRLSTLRLVGASAGFQTSGLTFNFKGQTIPLGLLMEELMAGGTSGSAGDPWDEDDDDEFEQSSKQKKETAKKQNTKIIKKKQKRDSISVFDMSRWGGFVSGQLVVGEKDETDIEAGYEYDSQSILLGVDYRINDMWIAGAALGIANAESEFANDEGGLDSGAWMLTGYTNYYFSDNAYVDGVITVGFNNYETVRNIVYSGVNATTFGESDGQQLGFSVGGGTELTYLGFAINPYGRLDYSDGGIDAYNETGDGLALSFEKQSFNSMVTVFGVRMTKVFSTKKAVIVPALDFEWEHEWEDDEQAINVSFVEDSSNEQFAVAVAAMDADYFHLGLSVAATLTGGKSLFARCQTVLGKENFSEYIVEFGGHIEF